MTRGSGRDGLKHDVRSAAQAPAQCQNLNHTLDFRHPEIRGIPITLMRKVGFIVLSHMDLSIIGSGIEQAFWSSDSEMSVMVP